MRKDLSCCRKAIAHTLPLTLVAVWRETRIVKFKARAAWFRKKHREEDSSSQKVL
jgi:hypothetical protein